MRGVGAMKTGGLAGVFENPSERRRATQHGAQLSQLWWMSALVVFEAVEASHVPLRLSHRPERAAGSSFGLLVHPATERFRHGHQSVRLSAPTHR